MSNHLYWGEGVYWLSSGEVKAPLLYHSSKQVTNLAISNTALRRLPEKTIVIIVRSGILKKYLPVAELQTTMAINQDIKGIILHEGVDSKYVLHALTYYGDKILRTCMKIGTTVQSVDLKWLKSFRIPLPPFPEQKRIAGIINTADEKIQTEQAYLAKLQNIKRGLMQDLLNNAVSVDALL
jgi:type I restriction enzyme S subunit